MLLLAPPYRLNQTEIGAIFVVYLTGVVASPWSGRMADTFGRARVLTGSLLLMALGLALTMLHPLAAIATGIACLTFGFFAGHSVASSWVGRLAKDAKAYQVPSNKGATPPPESPDFALIKLIDYDFAKYGSADERTRLLKKWEDEVNSQPR